MTRTSTKILGLAVLSLLAALVGCQSPGPITSRRTLVGSLKANVASLESENEQLRRQVVTLKADERKLEDQLVQERSNSDDLATRLDNAKHLLSQNGGLDREVSGRTDLDSPSSALANDAIPPPRARRSSRTPRKPPAASIPGQIEPSSNVPESNERLWEPQASRTRDDVWLPIAQGTGTKIAR